MKRIKTTSHCKGRSGHRGFSIIELLVALIIIGILAAILLPAISNRAEQARIARANTDIENISEALERTAIDTGFYVRMFALDDVTVGDGIAFDRPRDPNDNIDGLTDYLESQPFYGGIGTGNLFIDTLTGEFAVVSLDNLIPALVRNESTFSGLIRWHGPYINWQRDDNLFNNITAPDGLPDDPWGNNYLFFTEEGLVLEPDGEITSANVGVLDSGGVGTGASPSFDPTIFDRPTILSLGPNGVPGTGATGSEFGLGDDIVRKFGR